MGDLAVNSSAVKLSDEDSSEIFLPEDSSFATLSDYLARPLWIWVIGGYLECSDGAPRDVTFLRSCIIGETFGFGFKKLTCGFYSRRAGLTEPVAVLPLRFDLGAGITDKDLFPIVFVAAGLLELGVLTS